MNQATDFLISSLATRKIARQLASDLHHRVFFEWHIVLLFVSKTTLILNHSEGGSSHARLQGTGLTDQTHLLVNPMNVFLTADSTCRKSLVWSGGGVYPKRIFMGLRIRQ